MSSKLLVWLVFPRYRHFHKKRNLVAPPAAAPDGSFQLYIDPNDPADAEMRARWAAKRDAYDDRPSALD